MIQRTCSQVDKIRFVFRMWFKVKRTSLGQLLVMFWALCDITKGPLHNQMTESLLVMCARLAAINTGTKELQSLGLLSTDARLHRELCANAAAIARNGVAGTLAALARLV